MCEAVVYIAGDPNPVITTLEPTEVLAAIADLENAGQTDVAFLYLPLADGRGCYVRPRAVTLIGPPDLIGLDDEDEPDDAGS